MQPGRARGNLIAVAVILVVAALTVLSLAITTPENCHGYMPPMNDHGRGAITEWLPNCHP